LSFDPRCGSPEHFVSLLPNIRSANLHLNHYFQSLFEHSK